MSLVALFANNIQGVLEHWSVGVLALEQILSYFESIYQL
jgi:hypothetical protein